MPAVATDIFAIERSGTPYKATIAEALAACTSFIYQAADRAFTSTTSQQKIFDQTANGRVTLGTGLYDFDLMLYMSNMSGTSGNAALDLKGSGTAVIGDALLQSIGIDATNPLSAVARTGTGGTGALTLSPIAVAAAGTGLLSHVWGTFRVTTAGTLIPSLSLTTAATAYLESGSCLIIRKIAADGVYASPDFD